MAQDILKGKWNELTGKVKARWGKLTDDDLDRIEGQRDQIVGLLQQRYGYAKRKAEDQVDEFLSELEIEA